MDTPMTKVYVVTLYTQNEYGLTTYHPYVKLAFNADLYTEKVLKSLAGKLAKDENEKMHYPFVSTKHFDIELLEVH